MKELVLKIVFAALLIGFMYDGNAQPFPEGDEFRLGVSMGGNLSRLNGSELESPYIKPGMVIGAYYRQDINKSLQFLAELAFSLRGSNFNHTQENYYNEIKFVYMDLPLALLINTSGTEKDQHIVLGVEPAFQLQSEIYVNPDFRAQYRNYGFKKFDVAAMLGYHFDFYYFGLQPSLKIGLLNINDNINMPAILPATGNNGTIKNITFDLKFFF